jgi:hypothetical protein
VKNIVRYLEHRWIGFNRQTNKSWIESKVEFDDGSIGIVYTPMWTKAVMGGFLETVIGSPTMRKPSGLIYSQKWLDNNAQGLSNVTFGPGGES